MKCTGLECPTREIWVQIPFYPQGSLSDLGCKSKLGHQVAKMCKGGEEEELIMPNSLDYLEKKMGLKNK